MIKIINALKNVKGKEVKIHTDHKLYGKQNICMKFEPETEIGLGFKYKEQTIYIDNDDIVNYSINKDHIIINGNLMCIDIMLI